MGTLNAVSIYQGIKARMTGPADRGSQKFVLDQSVGKGLTIGTGNDAADLPLFSDNRSLTTGASDSLDLSGVLVNAFGETFSPAKIKAIHIKADPTNTTNLTVGNGTNPFVGPFGAGTHTLILAPGDEITLYSRAGWTVTNTSADILKITNAAGATAKYDIDILGASA